MSAPTTNTTSLVYIVNHTMGADVTGPQVPKELQTGMYIQAVVTGGSSPTGDFKIQSSSDALTWTDVANSSQSITGDGSVSWNIGPAYYKFWRLVYTFTSGSGTLDVSYNMI